MYTSSIVFSIVFVQIVSLVAAQEFDDLRVDNNIHQIVDSKNRIRIFHGVNLVCKHPPWYYTKLLDEKYAKNLGKWGLNVVRLGTMWSGIEPNEGEYSEKYIESLKKIVSNFEKYGIWVILDMHQDVAAKEFGTYDGFPPWLNKKFSETSKKDFPWPLEKVDNWFCGYLTYAACNSYQRLYDNYYEAADKMALAWKFIATSFKDHKNILGYDLLNEPWAGNIYKDGALLSPAVAAKNNLVPLYEKVVSRIREVDSKTLIFWETVPYSHWAPNLEIPFVNNNIGNQLRTQSGLELFLSMTSNACGGLKVQLDASDKAFCRSLKENGAPRNDENGLVDCIAKDSSPIEADQLFGTGFTRVPGGDKSKSVLSWHYYFPLFVYQGQDYGMMLKLFARNIFGPHVFESVVEEIQGDLGGAHFLTEFGLCTPDTDKPNSFGSTECNFVMDMADKHTLSWTYWDTATVHVLWDNDGNPVQRNVKGLSRPYPLKVSGRDISYKYIPETKYFSMKFTPTQDSGVTEIYIPELTFGKSPEMKITPTLPSEWITDSFDRLILRITNSGNVREKVKVEVAVEGSNTLKDSSITGSDSWLGQIQNVITDVFGSIGQVFGRKKK